MEALRSSLKNLSLSEVDHAGLLLQRYLSVQKEEGSDVNDRWEMHFTQVTEAARRGRDLYEGAYGRWLASTAQEEAGASVVIAKFRTDGRLVCGLGIASPVETGLAIHHTYGVPYIPGSSLKGVAAHYCHSRWGAADPQFLEEGKAHQALFGTTDDQGHIRFYDVLPQPGCFALHKDIMTPHHGDYYGQKEGAAPTDFDSPVPVGFLSASGSFTVILACDDPSEKGRLWLDLALELVKESLAEVGIGGKTRSGYGRLVCEGPIEIPGPPEPDPFEVGKVVAVRRIEQGTARGGKKNKKAKKRAEFLPVEAEAHLVIVRDFDSVAHIAIGDAARVRITENKLHEQNPYIEAAIETEKTEQ